MSGANFIDRTGQQFGRWTVLARTRQLKKVRWICRCNCGTIRDVATADLKSGRTNSCGCLVRNRKGKTIPQTNKREYHSWSGIKQRCYYKEHAEFHRYGGRGITMCNEWKDSFETFLRDMGSCPKGHSIERNDNDGPYQPDNCRWATRIEQASNTCQNVLVLHGGQVSTLKQLAQRLSLNYFSLHAYYRRRGLSLDASIARASQSRTMQNRCSPHQ